MLPETKGAVGVLPVSAQLETSAPFVMRRWRRRLGLQGTRPAGGDLLGSNAKIRREHLTLRSRHRARKFISTSRPNRYQCSSAVDASTLPPPATSTTPFGSSVAV